MDTKEPVAPQRKLVRIVLGAVISVAVIAGVSSWWIARPRNSAHEFIRLVSTGSFAEADAMLAGASSIEREADGNVVITSNDGTAFTFPTNELPLQGMDNFYYQPRPSNFDYLAGRYHFPLVSAGPAVRGDLQEPSLVSAVATTAGIVIVSVK
ncbi:hypothetical protein NA78x_001057 [Anatilimnocola sp. NA78]|uniref:hypothetical protein n=1 Tax=Anatilimnocola sp. NA78 TaxID=3415683 RepID=UPI003CE4A5AF